MAVTALSSDGKTPWDIASGTLATTDEWEVFEVPDWVRCVHIKNVHPTATLRVAASMTADGTAAPGAVQNAPVEPAGGSMTIQISGGGGVAPDSHRQIALHSTQASQTFCMLLEAGP